jgi:hypothetical protein
MRKGLVVLVVSVMGGLWLSAPGEAAPAPSLGDAAASARDSLLHQAQIFPRRYYRRNAPYAVPPVAPVAPVVPVVPPVVVQEPVVVVPMRPASCGEFHFWNGVACVDARYNKPYLGPRP